MNMSLPNRPPSDLKVTILLMAKEWRHTLSSAKFLAASVMVTLLTLLAVYLGLQEHRSFIDAQDGARALLAEDQSQVSDWMLLRHRVFRPAEPMQIFVAGVHRDLGRQTVIHGATEPELRQSLYGDAPLFALFRSFDISFVVTVVLSLFAVMFTYDAVSGEREQGTLRLLMAGAVPRSSFILAKALGLWAALLVPTGLAALLGVAMLPVFGIPFGAQELIRMAALAAAATLYLTVFVFGGVAVSAWTRRSSTSFLTLLAIWVVVVLVLPRAGLVAATQWLPVPSAAQIDAERRGFEDRVRQEGFRAMRERLLARTRSTQALPEEERQAYEDENMWAWIEEDDRARQEIEAEIQRHAGRLRESTAALRARQRSVAMALARLSPAATFQLTATAVADTGIAWLDRWQPAVESYREAFLAWIRSNGVDGSGRMVRRAGDGGSPFANREKPLDLSGMPQFVAPASSLGELLADLPFDLGLLTMQALLALALSLIAMLRYDVR